MAEPATGVWSSIIGVHNYIGEEVEMAGRMFFALLLSIGLVACGNILGQSASVTEVVVISTDTPMPTAPIFPTPTLAPGQIDLRGGFEGGLGPWEERIGSRVIARTVYHSGTGALQVIADEVNSRGDYTAISGQCVDLSGLLADWPLVNGERHITVEGYFKTDAKVASLSFGLTFHESTQCAGGAPLAPASQSIEGGMDWTQVVVYGSIPENAKSVDIFMVLVGMDSSATMYVDDILAYP